MGTGQGARDRQSPCITIVTIGRRRRLQADIHFDTTKLSVTPGNVLRGGAGGGLRPARASGPVTLPNGDIRVLLTGFNTNTIADGVVVNVPFVLNSGSRLAKLLR